MFLGIVGWVVVGLVVGFVGNKMVNLRGDDPKLSVGVAVGGAIVMGALRALISGSGVTAWSPWGLVFAALGGAAATAIWHAVRSYVSKERYVPRKSY